VQPDRLSIEALVRAPGGMAMLVGQAWLGSDAEVTRDHEHDAHAWWPADVDDWPDDAHPVLSTMARLLDER
jgi:hypothetical protein